jgi:hypothetical protein
MRIRLFRLFQSRIVLPLCFYYLTVYDLILLLFTPGIALHFFI